MSSAAEKRHRYARRRERFHDIVHVLRIGRMAARLQELPVALRMLTIAINELAEARKKYGRSLKTDLLQRSITEAERGIVGTFTRRAA